MPSFTTLIECTSPLLQLSANWRDGTSESDPLADQYSESSFTLTQTQGAAMTLSFNGTGISLVGAMRNNHGIYNVNVDGSTSTGNGFSNAALFQQTLYQVDDLALGQHKLVMTNENNTFFDIDYVLVTTQVGNPSESLIVNMFKDGHPSFSYTPSSSWTTPQNLSSFVGASGHATQSPSASMSLTFDVSDGVAIYGPVGPTEATSYIVQVDGAQLQTFSARNQFYRSQQILFFATGLGGSTHTVTMQIEGNSVGELAIDFANVYTAPSLGGSYASVGVGENATAPQNITTSPSLPTSGATSSPTIVTVSVIPHGIIAALAILAVLAFGGILTSAYLLWRRIQDLRKPTPEPGHPPKTSQAIVQPFLLDPYSPTTDIAQEPISAAPARSTLLTTWNNTSDHSQNVSTSGPSHTHAYTSTVTSSSKSGSNRLSDPATRPPRYEYSPS